MRHIIRRCLILAALVGAPMSARALPFSYTETGLISGSLNGVDFSSAQATITTTSDTSLITSATLGGYPNLQAPGVTTIAIDGLPFATLTGDVYGVVSVDLSSIVAGEILIGLGDLTTAKLLLGTEGSAALYGLAVAYTLGGPAAGGSGTFSTDQGSLVLTRANSDTVFTAIPEPSVFVPMLTGLLGLAMLRCRRR